MLPIRKSNAESQRQPAFAYFSDRHAEWNRPAIGVTNVGKRGTDFGRLPAKWYQVRNFETSAAAFSMCEAADDLLKSEP